MESIFLWGVKDQDAWSSSLLWMFDEIELTTTVLWMQDGNGKQATKEIKKKQPAKQLRLQWLWPNYSDLTSPQKVAEEGKSPYFREN